jgi:hypothetical protein
MTKIYGTPCPLPLSPKLAPRASLDQAHITVSLCYHVFLEVECGLTFELLPQAPQILELITIKINTLRKKIQIIKSSLSEDYGRLECDENSVLSVSYYED